MRVRWRTWPVLCAALAAAWLAGNTSATWPAVAAALATPSAPSGPSGPRLNLISFDSQSYPALSATVTVWDPAAGLPMAGLGAANFGAAIDGKAAVISQVVPLTTTPGAPLQVVFLVDSSVPDDGSLDKVLSAVGSFVDSLGASDQAALMTVADSPQLAVAFTSDRAQLRAGLAHVNRVVSKTSLHQGIAQAAKLFDPTPGTQTRLVLVFTNTGDMPATPVPAAEAIRQAQAASAAVSLFDYTGVDAGKSLAGIAAETGGHFYLVANASQVDPALKTLATQLHQGYQIAFTTSLRGDGAEHTASLTLAGPGGTASVEQSFKAPLAEIMINGPGLTDGQTVAGVVQLATTAVVPAPPVASVEYRLDGRSLAILNQPPFTFQWDSTSVSPGEHVLQVVVRDSGGNSGQLQVRAQVALPFAVTASTDRGQVNIGDKVTLRAQVSSPARIDHVEFWKGDQTLLASIVNPPYAYTFDSQGQGAGIESFKVRAVDYLGRTAETDPFHIDFRPTVTSSAPLIGHWVLVSILLLAIIIALAVALFGSLALGARLKRSLHSVFKLEIANEGNVRNRYALRAEEAQGALSFDFQINGARLPVQTMLVLTTAAAPAAISPAPAAQAAAVVPTRSTSGPAISDVKKTGAYQSYAKTSGVSAAIGSFLTTIAALLPGSAGTSLRGTAETLQQGESLGYSIDQADTQVKSVQHSAAATASAVGLESNQPSAETPAAASAPASPPAGPIQKSPAASETWALTPYVEAGEKLAVQLLTRPLKSARTASYGVRIVSRLLEVADIAPVTESGNVTVRGLSWFQRLQPLLLAGALLVMAAGLTALLVHVWGG
jgi:hypothetical protein